jgi:hypothetical protein
VTSKEQARTDVSPRYYNGYANADDSDDEYIPSWERRELTPPPPPPHHTSPIAWIAVCISTVAIVLWIATVGVGALPGGHTGQGSIDNQTPYQVWLDQTKATLANRMYPPANKMRHCLVDKDTACACAVKLPDTSYLLDDMQQTRQVADSGYSATQTALLKVLTSYAELRAVKESSCNSGGNATNIESSLERYTAAHDQFVDAVRAIQP